jgi:hypothetical protein
MCAKQSLIIIVVGLGLTATTVGSAKAGGARGGAVHSVARGFARPAPSSFGPRGARPNSTNRNAFPSQSRHAAHPSSRPRNSGNRLARSSSRRNSMSRAGHRKSAHHKARQSVHRGSLKHGSRELARRNSTRSKTGHHSHRRGVPAGQWLTASADDVPNDPSMPMDDAWARGTSETMEEPILIEAPDVSEDGSNVEEEAQLEEDAQSSPDSQ